MLEKELHDTCGEHKCMCEQGTKGTWAAAGAGATQWKVCVEKFLPPPLSNQKRINTKEGGRAGAFHNTDHIEES
jgi:hypothetical protein